MLLQKLNVIAFAASALCFALGTAALQLPRPEGVETGPITATCKVYCEFEMGDINKVLRVGEKVKSPDDPCSTYVCDVDGTMRVEIETCNKIDSCLDQKPPYLLPTGCCEGCDYLNPLSFQLGPETQELVSPDKNSSKPAERPTSPPPNTWSAWTSWTECSLSCGGGRHSRMRECLTTRARELDCTGLTVEIKDCNTHNCPIHGGWTDFTDWSECSTTCDNGTETRTRSCTNPAPQYGGRDCEGEHTEIQVCFLKHCPVDCKWLPWSEWGGCSHDCGGGIQTRARDKLLEQYGGAPCEGNSTEMRGCNKHHCPVHGNWSVWSQWSECTTTCDEGTQTRHRECNNPAPAYGGDNCTGEPTETQACPDLLPCPVDCKWSAWSNWTDCSLSCGGGTQSHSRTFEPALHGGKECEGPADEAEICNTQNCPDPCVDSGVHPCFSDAVICTKVSDTEFSCADCPRGMEGDGITCTAVNECDVGSPCFTGVECVDYDDGFSCGECPAGYTGSTIRGYDLQDAVSLQQECTDVNECELQSNGGCHERRVCQNTEGSFECGPCEDGYVEQGPVDCLLADPCAAEQHNCEKTAYCINHIVGAYYCECPVGLIGNGLECAPDPDLDRVPNTQLTIGCDNPPCPVDNCPDVPNSAQSDKDNDGVGDMCDDDIDNDGILNEDDNCDSVSNSDQSDVDGDRVGNACDVCLFKSNPGQGDIDGDGIGDDCDSDRDGDSNLNQYDNCPMLANPNQKDSDRDGWGDDCDNCKRVSNRDQSDDDMDGVGNKCDKGRDVDKDGIKNAADNCKNVMNTDQLDHDKDGRGDACDPDDDNDGWRDRDDNCPLVVNYDQADSDGDGRGDACATDYDGDGVDDSEDVCPLNGHISRTSFFDAIKVRLDKSELEPSWDKISETDVKQTINSGPGLLLSRALFRSFQFTGTVYVDSALDNDYFGLVYNYYSNKKFMLVAWKKSNDSAYWKRSSPNAETHAGLQIKAMDSVNGPYNNNFKMALWNSNDISRKQGATIWKDPNAIGWEHKTVYFFKLEYSAVQKCTRVRIYQGSDMIIDSGCQCRPTGVGAMEGGKLGLYTFSQHGVVYSDLQYKCFDEAQFNQAAKCDAK